MSYIIQQSAEIGKPVIGISINYRLGGFGFLFGKDVMVSVSLTLY
jgi:carboxylesterase type B